MRLIDADALEARMYHEAFETDSNLQKWDNGCWIRYKMFDNAMAESPTVDPVKHGKWIEMSDADGVYWACSECGEDIPRVSHYNPQFDLFPRLDSIEKTRYCPFCGAWMEVDDGKI